MPNLKVRDRGREFTFQIEDDETTIGRAATNGVEIQDAKASKEHCQIQRVGTRWKVVDLESKNGTRVNGQFCNKAWLNHGDTIQIGSAEIRFGVEGAARAAPAAARAPAPPRAVQAAYEGDYDDYEDQRPVRSRYKKTNTWLILSLAALGVVVIVIVLGGITGRTTFDEYNAEVIEQANRLVADSRYDEAMAYLQKNGDPNGNGYFKVEQRMHQLREQKEPHERNVKQQAASTVLSKLARRIRAYHAGKQSATPEIILELVERMKTKYPDTQATEDARRMWPAWFAGRVPQRATELLRSSGKLGKDWDAAVARAEQFRKEQLFREARETIERFVTAREAVLDQADLERYQRMRDDQLDKLDRLAESVYRGQEQRARRLLKNKRYDQAIGVYQKIIEKFGIDYYVRRAQAEIDKIEKLKTSGG